MLHTVHDGAFARRRLGDILLPERNRVVLEAGTGEVVHDLLGLSNVPDVDVLVFPGSVGGDVAWAAEACSGLVGGGYELQKGKT